MNKIIMTILPLTFAVLTVSCGSYQKIDYYLLNPSPPAGSGGEPFPYTLSVAEVSAPSRYGERMVFRGPGLETGYYENSRWMEVPAEMVRVSLTNALRASGLFRQVASRGLLPRPGLILRTNIVSFDQVIEGKKNFAECALDFHLLSAKDGRFLWSYAARVRLPQNGPGRFADTMSQALAEVIAKALSDLRQSSQLKTLSSEKISD